MAAEGPSETALIFESRLWHAMAPNIEKEGENLNILVFFMRSFIHQRENNFKSLRDDVEALWDIARLGLWEVLRRG